MVPGLITSGGRAGPQGRLARETASCTRAPFLPSSRTGWIDTFVSARHVREAAARSLSPDGPVIVACDVARYGNSKTVAVRREGPVVEIVRRVQGHSTMDTANFLKHYADHNQVDFLIVDDVGVGGGVTDRLRETGVRRAKLLDFNSGGKAEATGLFANRITECWFRMVRRYEAGDIDTPNDEALIAQVIARKYELTSAGKPRVESKDKSAASPDEADALAMTFAVKPEEG